MSASASAHAKIQAWIQEVAQETLQRPTSPKKSTHPMTLRRCTRKSHARQPLQGATGNQRDPKIHLEKEGLQSANRVSKRIRRAMDNDKQSNPKKRGRPRKKTTAEASTALNFIDNPCLQLRPESQVPSLDSSPARSEEGVPNPGYVKPNADFSLNDLRSCQPRVFQMDITSARQSGSVPPAVETLYRKLTSVKYACIPPDLKVYYPLPLHPLECSSVTVRQYTILKRIRRGNQGMPRPTKSFFHIPPSNTRRVEYPA